MIAPSSPSEFGNQVDDLAKAYSPEQLRQKYAITKELIYLLALQKEESKIQAAQRELIASQEQTEGTVKDQLEQNLMERAESVAELLGQPQGQPQGQTRMVAQGGIIGYSNGGDVEEREPFSYEGLGGMETAAALVGDAANWASENPVDAASLGLMLIPGVGWAGVGISKALQGAGLAYRALQGADKAKALKKVGDAAKSTVTRKKDGLEFADDVGDGTVIGNIPKQTGIKTTREFSLPRATVTSGVAAGTAQGLGALTDDEEESSEDQGAANQGIGSQGTQGRGPMGAKTDDFDVKDIKLGREDKDFIGLAKQQAPTMEEILGPQSDEIVERANKDLTTVGRNATQDYLSRLKAEEKLQEIQNIYDQLKIDKEKLYNPEKMARERRIATFANVGGTGVGQIFGNMSKAFLETQTAQDALLGAHLEKMAGNELKVIELQTQYFDKGEAAGQFAIDVAAADKREAMNILANASKSEKESYLAYAQELRQSDNDEITRQFKIIDALASDLDRINDREIAKYEVAEKVLVAIDEVKGVAYTTFLQSNPKFLELELEKNALLLEGKSLRPEQQKELKQYKDRAHIAVQQALSLAGLLRKQDMALETTERFRAREQEQSPVLSALRQLQGT